MKKYLLSLLIILSSAIIFAPALILAQGTTNQPTVDTHGLDITAEHAKLVTKGSEPELATMVGNVIRRGLEFLGIVFMLLIIVGGLQWMTAQGNEDKVAKAKTMIVAAFSGIIIVFLSYVLTSLIIEALTATGSEI